FRASRPDFRPGTSLASNIVHVEVLAVALNYLPEAVLWLVTTPLQARLMRDTQPRAVVFTLGEAADLAMSLGDTRPPTSLWQVAVEFSTPAPSSPEDPPEEWEDVDDSWG
ncbi:MAG TPA: hypothetical protein VFR53_11315, partial [Methylomirabilota bacterium]|nr:hypothetical protein [Methylomirabilota bacterium]